MAYQMVYLAVLLLSWRLTVIASQLKEKTNISKAILGAG